MNRRKAPYESIDARVTSGNVGESVFQPALWAEAPRQIAGPASAPLAANAYSFTLIDSQNLVSSAIEAQIAVCAQYVIGLVSSHVAWKGTLDFVVDIRPASQSVYPEINGILPSYTQIAWNGQGWVNQTLAECITGIDADPNRYDAGCTIYLAADGTIRNYDVPVWFDPNPQHGVDPHVPANVHDFVGILTHEIFHSLGFDARTEEWRAMMVADGPVAWFTGAEATMLYNGRLPFAAGTDHYGYTADPAIPISRGLMFQWGNYHLNRWDIGRIDLAILADLGHTIKSYDGLPLFEMIDTSLNLTGAAGRDRLYGDYHANRLDGGRGSDRLEGGGGADIFVFAALGDSSLHALRSDGAKFMPDVISDFVPGQDRIDLSAIDAVAGTAGNDAFAFLGTGAFTGHAGELRYEVRGGRAHIFADVDGNGLADMEIVVSAPLLAASDFIL